MRVDGRDIRRQVEMWVQGQMGGFGGGEKRKNVSAYGKVDRDCGRGKEDENRGRGRSG